MKWGKVIEQNIVLEWKKFYISYKALKKIIKKLRNLIDNETDEGYQQLQSEFDELIAKDLNTVECFYKRKECQLLEEFSTLSDEQKSTKLYQLEKYAYLNAEGFRKIIKKYDKKLSKTLSKIYLPIFKTKSFYYHRKIQQLHTKLTAPYKPISYELINHNQPHESIKTYEYTHSYKIIPNLNTNDLSISLISNSDYNYNHDYGDNSVTHYTQGATYWKLVLLKYLHIAKHPKVYISHLLYIFIILSFIMLTAADIYFTQSYKKNWNFFTQKMEFKQTSFYAFWFPLFIFSLCALITMMISCGKYLRDCSRYNCIKIVLIITSPITATVLFGVSPILVILITLLLIDREAIWSLRISHNVSYEIMFMHQVNNYYYNTLLKENTELINNNYYQFNFYALRVLFLSILHLYRIHDDDIKNMYLEIINKFIQEEDEEDDVDDEEEDNNKQNDKDIQHHLKYQKRRSLKLFNEIFVSDNEEFYFVHSNHDQQQSSWLSLLTTFQCYCILFFAVVCFQYILWWISFGWSSYSLFENFNAFSGLLQFWAIRDGTCSILCAIYVWLRHRYMYYSMLYDYSWFHQDLRQLILDNLVPHDPNHKYMRRTMRFSKRFGDDDNEHRQFVMDHLMPILRHTKIREVLTKICFHQFWMVNIIMTYSCDFGMYVIPCIDRKINIKEAAD